jgi:CRISPR-associated endonuclease Cas2
MAIYLLAYDLVNESKGTFDYQPLWDELKRLGAFRTQYSLWLVNANTTAQQLVEHFKRFVDNDDRLWVTSVRKGEHWYTNAISGTNKWLENNPPT